MKKILKGFCIATVVLFAVSASAQDKVVVVPLGSGAKASPSGDSWIRIYDNNDVFIGYSFDGHSVINAKKYFTSISYDSSSKTCSYQYVNMTSAYFYSADCSGSLYGSTDYQALPFYGPGRVATYRNTTHVYIPLNATPVSIPTGATISTWLPWSPETCEMTVLTEPKELIQFLPNDPTVTGFPNPNTIAMPLKAVYTLPTTP